jgi:hypothetical protein
MTGFRTSKIQLDNREKMDKDKREREGVKKKK